MKNQKNIEELFKDVLKEHEITPPSWDVFEKKYNRLLRTKHIKNLSIISTIAAIIIAASILMHNSQTKDNNRITNNVQITTKNPTHATQKPNIKTTIAEKQQQQKKPASQSPIEHKSDNITQKKTNLPDNHLTKNTTYQLHNYKQVKQPQEQSNIQQPETTDTEEKNNFTYNIDKFKGCAPFTTKIHFEGTNIKKVFAKYGASGIELTYNKIITLEKNGTYFI